MSFVIYKQKLTDFVNEVKLKVSPSPVAYVMTYVREIEKGHNSFFVVLSAFNAEGEVVHFHSSVASVIKTDPAKNEKAKEKSLNAAAIAKAFVEKNNIVVRPGVLGSIKTPSFGSIDLGANV